VRNIKRADYDQLHLLPPSLEDWVGERHPARFIREFVQSLDLARAGFKEPNPEEGGECYAAELLLTVWLYGYFCKIRSTRRLEQACLENVGFMWLCGLHRPDHNALWRFWNQNKASLKELFKTTVKVSLKLGLISLALQAIDGTKIQAVATKHGSYDLEHNRKLAAKLEQSIGQLEKQIASAGSGEQETVAELSQDLGRKERLKEKVQAAIQQIEQQEASHLHPQEPEARRMRTEGPNRFSYNAQAAVESKNQIVTAAEVHNQENDQALLVTMIEAAKANTGQGCPKTLADTGYSSGQQLAQAQARGLEVIAPLNKRVEGENNPYHSNQFRYVAEQDTVICPQQQELKFHHRRQRNGVEVKVYRNSQACAGCPVRSLCTRDRHGRAIDVGPYSEAIAKHRAKMRDPALKELLKQRSRIVEPVFGQIKENGGFRRWTVRGLKNVQAQWSLLCATWNLQKIFHFWQRKGRDLSLKPA
jgi:transposase